MIIDIKTKKKNITKESIFIGGEEYADIFKDIDVRKKEVIDNISMAKINMSLYRTDIKIFEHNFHELTGIKPQNDANRASSSDKREMYISTQGLKLVLP